MDDKVNLSSLDIKQDKIEQLKKAFPEVVTEGKVDFERLKNELGGEVEAGKERYEMKWPGKSNLQKIIQEPSIGTLKPVKEASVDFDNTENLFIEGDSLEVLKLLQKSYYGKIKMIYIDPPYNTGNDFVYPDNYSESLDTYLRYTGQKGEEGFKLTTNAETDGRYHSKWMNMMYPRLFLARNLLKEVGVIFISIDDHEVDNLKKMCNEIFGEENFLTQIAWRRQDGQTNIGSIARVKEYILVYCKSDSVNLGRLPLSDKAKKDYQYQDEKGFYGRGRLREPVRGRYHYALISPTGTEALGPWLIPEDEFKKLEKDGMIHWPESGGSPRKKIYLDDMLQKGQIPNDFWGIEFGTNQRGSIEVEELFNGRVFDFPKPMSLIKHLLAIGTSNEDIILDFFAGSATTAHAVLDFNKDDGGNRKFIIVQLQEPTSEDSEAKKAGFDNIAQIGEERIRRVIKKIKEENQGKLDFDGRKMDLGFKVFRLDKSNFKVWDKKSDVSLQEQLQFSVDNIEPGSNQLSILYEIILKSGFELSVPIEEIVIQGMKVYSIDNKSLVICLEDNLTSELMKEISGMEAARVVCLDKGFSGNDELKTNTVELMKAKCVEFKTV